MHKMEESATKIKPGTLWSKTTQRTKTARESGALQSIETEYHLIQQQDISFVVRTLSNLARKERALKRQCQIEAKINHQSQKIDPFLPYEPELFVGDISSTHICLLNKFNVVDNHILIVTRAFEEQTDLLNLEDFVALWSCMQEIEGLAFFNGGKTAGASQRHKHLQLIPLPFLPNVMHLPLDQAINKIKFQNSLGRINSFPFRHSIIQLDISPQDSVEIAANIMLQSYHKLLSQVMELDDHNQHPYNQKQKQPLAYNFLATKNWMLIVPRSQESFQNISINSLGFAGSLFVRDQTALELLKNITPLKLLTQVAFS